MPSDVFELTNLRIFDVSNNSLKELSISMSNLGTLKVFKCDNNELKSLHPLETLEKLNILSAAGNQLDSSCILLPPSLKELNLTSNNLQSIPRSLSSLVNLQVLNLSQNNLVDLPAEIYSNLTNLVELTLDDNQIISLPDELGQLKKLKVLSLKRNLISGTVTPQALPTSLFTETSVIDLNLQGNNQITSTQLNEFDGFDKFLERRKEVKNKDLSGFDQLSGKFTCGLT